MVTATFFLLDESEASDYVFRALRRKGCSIFSSRLSDIHMSRFASVARYSALILRSNHIDYNK